MKIEVVLLTTALLSSGCWENTKTDIETKKKMENKIKQIETDQNKKWDDQLKDMSCNEIYRPAFASYLNRNAYKPFFLS